MILELNGFRVIGMAKNGQEAIEMYSLLSEKPDIILMDHRMPIKNGLEASKEILKMDNHAHIIFASADNSIKEEVYSMGILSFIDKPFSNQILIEEINKVLERSEFNENNTISAN